MRRVGVGVVGLGWMGWIHAATVGYLRDARLAAVCDVDEARLRAAEEAFGARGYHDYRRLADDPHVDAVIVAVPPYLNRAVVEAAVAAGKHILCEKPLAHTLEDARAIVQATRDYPRRFMVGFSERFFIPNAELKRFVEEGSLGDVLFMRANCRWASKRKSYGGTLGHGRWLANPELGGGVIIEAGVHYFDLARWLTGLEFAEVCAEVHSPQGRPGEEDLFLLSGELTNGAVVLVDVVTELPKGAPTDRRVEVVGSKGAVYVDQMTNPLLVVSEKGVEVSPGLMSDGVAFPESMYTSKEFGAVRRELEHFVSTCLVEGKQPHPTAEDGLRALEVALAAARSARQHEPVALQLG